MDCIEKCDNCKRARTLQNETLVCDVGKKNKVLYDGHQYTSEYYWCDGKYQQQIGKEGRHLLDDLKSGKIFENSKEFEKFKKSYEKLEKKIGKGEY